MQHKTQKAKAKTKTNIATSIRRTSFFEGRNCNRR
jgi:hypothetical protein